MWWLAVAPSPETIPSCPARWLMVIPSHPDCLMCDPKRGSINPLRTALVCSSECSQSFLTRKTLKIKEKKKLEDKRSFFLIPFFAGGSQAPHTQLSYLPAKKCLIRCSH